MSTNASVTHSPLKHFMPGWYAVVMGLCGLSLAWHRAVPLMGELAVGVSMVVGALAAVVFAVLAVATILRGLRHPEAWAEDRAHPVRHTFIAALPIAIILLATVGVAHLGPNVDALRALWWVGCLSQLWVTVWVLARWWRPKGLVWASMTPALFIPIVGNVVVPLAGVPLGHHEWAAAQFGVGLMLWPVVLVMLLVRIATQGLWPDRLLPAGFILIAPPTVVGLGALQFGAPLLVGWGLWGMAAFCAVWAFTLAPRIAKLPFGLPHWAMSFPLAALAAFTLRLATSPGVDTTSGLYKFMTILGPLLLALASLVIAGLLLATVRGLRDGTLLAPEPVAAIVPAQP